MKVVLVCVGRPRGTLAEAIAGYEKRIGHYFPFEAIEVKESTQRARPITRMLDEEGDRLLARVPAQTELIALHRPGRMWRSADLAQHLNNAGITGSAGITFAIGGAFGLSRAILDRANHHMSLSSMTLPHELARLVLAEQIYRAGTIIRGEPYHKLPQDG
jgi:23S rRNA (pseudouridine1915-N3)-methyltransferase